MNDVVHLAPNQLETLMRLTEALARLDKEERAEILYVLHSMRPKFIYREDVGVSK